MKKLIIKLFLASVFIYIILAMLHAMGNPPIPKDKPNSNNFERTVRPNYNR